MTFRPHRYILPPLFAVVVSAAACSKQGTSVTPAAPPLANDKGAIQIGEKFKLFSKVLKEDRQYWVHLPQTYKPGRPASTSYPVLYVLDGESRFETAVATVKFLNGLAMIPEMVVVGVISTDQRMRDMTPTRNTKGSGGELDPRFANSGGGEAFEKFLETDLIPKIESTYPTMPYRVLAGHSLSGLLSLHAGMKEATAFQAIIAMDPSLFWDEQVVVKQAAERLSKSDGRLKSIYVSRAGLPPDDVEDVPALRAATQAFASVLSRTAPSMVRSKVQTFERENHQSVPFPSLYDGLLFTFEGYKLSTLEALKDPSRIDTHYRDLSAKFGVEWQPPQSLIDLVSATLLFEKKQTDDAIRLLERGARSYPNSADAVSHLGQAYMIKGDKASAIRCFERALELDPNDDDVRAELAKLRK
jgi:hypothetical protein